MFSCACMQEFLQEISQRDKMIESLVSFAYPEGEVEMAITRCGYVSALKLLQM